MSAVHDTARQLGREVRGALSSPWQFPLLRRPGALTGYVSGVFACYLALTTWQAVQTPVAPGDVTLFAALMCCGAICVEASRRLGQPTGVWRDLLSAWWLPVALLLPPLYALYAPAVLGVLIYLRMRPSAVYRRAFSSAAVGLAGAAASALFRLLTPVAPEGRVSLWLTYPGPNAGLLHPRQAAAAVACGVLFGVLNACLVAVAAWLAGPDARLADMLWDRERMLLDLTETCVGVLVTIVCTLSPFWLAVMLPPVVVLQRCLLYSQLKAQARTDPKTGMLNAGAWQEEAGLAIDRARRHPGPLAVLLADVDHFKRVNDRHGHLTGDEVLRRLAAEMRRQVRESDLVGRFGGEEFAILLGGATEDEACRVAERIRRAAGAVTVLSTGTIVSVTISIGVAVLGGHGGELSALLDAADKALYRAKRTGRDRVCLACPATTGN